MEAKLEDKLAVLQAWLDEAKHAVFFGGAGVSTESGIPDFRSKDGWASRKTDVPFETALSHDYFCSHTRSFFDFYFKAMATDAEPNAAHLALADFERAGKIKAVITQNIDGLHQAAGSRNVCELHGSIHRNTCTRCGRRFTLNELRARRPLPTCDCGGVIKPDVVLYGEALDDATVSHALEELSEADLVIVGGTSLSVYPAAGFLRATRGKIVLINKDELPASPIVPDLTLTASVSVLRKLKARNAFGE